MPERNDSATSSPGRWRGEHVRQRVSAIGCRLSGWPRRAAALALLLTAAVLATRPGVAPGVEPGGPTIWVAARDLPAGATVTTADVRAVRWPAADPLEGALSPSSPLPRMRLAGPVRAGEPLTDVRFIGPSLAEAVAGSGAVIVPVRLADAEAASLLQPGDRIDVLAADGSSAGPPKARVVAAGARVLAVPTSVPANPLDGALIVVAATPDAARLIAGVPTGTRLTTTVHGP